MLEQIMWHIHNWFERSIEEGDYTIVGGSIDLPFLQDGQYYRIIGSVFNDGLHQYGDAEDVLTSETFHGEIWALAPPKQFLKLAEEINDWCNANQKALDSPYSSENVIGVYSYALKDGGSGGSGNASQPISWQTQFRAKLNPWRKLAP